MQDQVTHEEYGDTAQTCRNGVRKAKAPLELNLTRDVKDSKKGFCRYINNRRKTGINVGLLLNGTGALVRKDMKNVVVNASSTVFTGKTCLQESLAPETSRRVWSKEDFQ